MLFPGANSIRHAGRSLARELLPPALLQLCRRLRHRRSAPYGFRGSYATWELARQASAGYDSPVILERMLAAALRVKRGEAAYERDGVVFDEVQYSWPLLAGLMWAAAETGGPLRVLDFGGALGTTYFQNRRFLGGLQKVVWGIVEQPHVVTAGRRQIQDETIRFFEDIDSCCREISPEVAIFSSALQYVENPYTVIRNCIARKVLRLVIDLTPFSDTEADRICVQHVPESIYPASYPAWILSRPKFHKFLAAHEILADVAHAPFGQPSGGGVYRSFVVRARPDSSVL